MSPLISAVISLTGLLLNLTMTSILNLQLQTHLNQIIIALNPISVCMPYTGQLGTLLTLTVHHLLLNFSVYQNFHLLKRRTSTDFLRTVLDKQAPPSLRKVVNHDSSPWFESITDGLLIAKKERRQAESKWRNTMLAIFNDLYRQAKHKVSKLVHTAKCKFYNERIALASSSKELQQIVNTL